MPINPIKKSYYAVMGAEHAATRLAVRCGQRDHLTAEIVLAANPPVHHLRPEDAYILHTSWTGTHRPQ